MKHIQIIMPEVSECSVQACGFNKNSNCHARAITIGERNVPECGTFFTTSDISAHAKSEGRISGVGACKIADCIHNDDYECMANDIVVAFSHDHANCQTYARR